MWGRRPAVSDDRVFFGGITGILYALDAGSGKEIWKRDFGSRVSTHLTISDDDLYLGTANGHLYRVTQKTGEVKADFTLGVTPVGVPVISQDALFIYLNPHGGDGGAETLACLDLSLTKVRWSQRATGDWSLTRPYLWRGSVLAGNEAGEVVAFHVNDGAKIGAHLFKGTIRSIGGAGDVLYVGTLNGTVYAYAAEQGKKPSPSEIKELRTELEKMMEEDQKFRTRVMAVEEKYGQNSKELAALWKEQAEIDSRLLKRLEEIIKQYGWPGVSMVGREASLAAFLIIQHADYEYQKKYFPLINEAMKKGEIEPGHVALLEDRILMHEGKKQIYGSQLRKNEKTGKYEMWPVEDEENLDKRRASVGLEPIAEYLKRFGVTYIPPKKR
jgi:outer membrane protein assembly factor BamB